MKNNQEEAQVKDSTVEEGVKNAEAKHEATEEAAVDETDTEKVKNGEEAAQKEKEVTKEEEDIQTRYLRLAADFQNYKRRVEKEKSDIYAYANEKIVTELLDVIDNFERAIAHGEDCKDPKMLEGMAMIFKQFKGVLEKSNVEEIKAEGEAFDPNYHHAVMTENSVEYESGKVTAVLQKGYLLNGKVIRPSMVKVAE
ncbi:nucleotide exchange factor GrpE [Sinanaerobacter sp. ZZT-01]|uniref:nucleotide exchange factor GrpE n=1 Tax=Sinanaerobacter sp. ZZT-01 TaxID=3111540 RepID=UPI002D78B33E|nr:nucleotide exchange factor GrpE [Sinanaerobacter sp. ZZT-01]WRR92868.1 nucleotide exchange factor GrpE [Sinanaerobacter sp. ZZT-01]